MREIQRFKGGSLSYTSLMEDAWGNRFVRKTVSLMENREYGFQRWYSQLKRMQRYSVTHPGLFPKVIKFGKMGDIAYFDIEYFPGAVNAHEYIQKIVSQQELDRFFDTLIKTMNEISGEKIHSNPEAMELYIFEEIEQRLKDCNKNKAFVDFLSYREIVFNGRTVTSFVYDLDDYKEISRASYKNAIETFTHGNITLENLLYIPDEQRIIYIDPYEENIIDSILAEFSQLLQSTNSKYEIYNSAHATVKGNDINLDISISFGIDYLNNKIIEYIKKNYSYSDYLIVKVFEISQFIRMLPFKMEVDESKMIFFYGLASSLLHDLKEEYRRYMESSNEEG